MNVRATLAAVAVAGTLIGLTGPANAVTLVEGTGWVEDTITAANALSIGSPVTFTVGAGQSDIFSLTDAFVAGDVYTVTVGGVTSISTFTSYPVTFPLGIGASPSTYDAAWADNSFSHLQLGFSAGTYSLSITGDGSGGIPASFAYRLDPGSFTVSAVPETSTWAMMIMGFAGLGLVARRRKAAVPLGLA